MRTPDTSRFRADAINRRPAPEGGDDPPRKYNVRARSGATRNELISGSSQHYDPITIFRGAERM
jgi:hypothetical protein